MSDVERSITIMTLTSRRVDLAEACSVTWSRLSERMKMNGRSTLAVVVIDRMYVESVAATLLTCRFVEAKYPAGKLE